LIVVTIRQCAVLMRGLQSGRGGLTADLPEPLLDCGGRPVLAWLMREFIRFGVEEFVLLAGDLSAQAEARIAALPALLPRAAQLIVSHAPPCAGTGGAIFRARRHLDQAFLLCDGDSLFDCNLARLLSAADSGVAGRMLLRETGDPSRHGVVRMHGDMVDEISHQTGVNDGWMTNPGIYRFDRTLLDELSPDCSLEADILPRLAARGALRGTVADGWFRDIGIAGDQALGPPEISRPLRRRALFLDRDGVVNVDHGYVGSRERFEWMQGAREAIRAATEAGWHVFVITNQSGVARGLFDEAAVIALHTWMADEARRAGGTIDDIRYCPFHADAVVPAYRRVSDWRKPAPGMLLDLMRAWELDADRCVVVGDQDSDMAAAAAAGITGFRFRGGNLLDFICPILERDD
jgi:D-glycero-D-manno-heptose 1,7-bisphosphate phosphatase